MAGKNNKLSLALIYASLIFLLGFLIYWNTQNYQSEKNELRSALIKEMSLACSEYRDSIIQDIFHVFEVETKSDFRVFRNSRIADNRDSSYLETIIIGSRFEEPTTSMSLSIELRDSTEGKSALDSVPMLLEVQRNILAWRSDSTQSFTFEVPHDSLWRKFAKDSTFLPSLDIHRPSQASRIPQAYYEIDTIYTERLRNVGLPMTYQIIDSKSAMEANKPKIIVPFEFQSISVIEHAPPNALFTEYGTYLIKKIGPAVAASSFLFLLVSLSFYLIHSNWKNEEHLAKIRTEFMSNMTHELKTPLATVGIALEALDNFGAMDDARKRKEYIDISRHELNRLGILVDKVLKMTTLGESFNELNLEPQDIRLIIEEIKNNMKVHLESNRVELSLELEDNLPEVLGDKIHLTNVFYNLIDNAIKYSKEEPKISIVGYKERDNIIISIEDNGIGIAKEYVDKVFDRLFRVPTNDVHEVKGHGLGLHYVQAVIKEHRGQIALTSEVGKGSTFIIKIPIIDE